MIVEHVDIDEAKSIFESNYSHVYFILYDTFVQAETNLRQRGKLIQVWTYFTETLSFDFLLIFCFIYSVLFDYFCILVEAWFESSLIINNKYEYLL